MTEPLETRRKRLLFRAWHRGTRETDLLLGSFAERHLGGFGPAQLAEFERILEIDDPRLFDWLTGRSAPPPEHDGGVMRLLLQFKYTARSA